MEHHVDEEGFQMSRQLGTGWPSALWKHSKNRLKSQRSQLTSSCLDEKVSSITLRTSFLALWVDLFFFQTIWRICLPVWMAGLAWKVKLKLGQRIKQRYDLKVRSSCWQSRYRHSRYQQSRCYESAYTERLLAVTKCGDVMLCLSRNSVEKGLKKKS